MASSILLTPGSHLSSRISVIFCSVVVILALCICAKLFSPVLVGTPNDSASCGCNLPFRETAASQLLGAWTIPGVFEPLGVSTGLVKLRISAAPGALRGRPLRYSGSVLPSREDHAGSPPHDRCVLPLADSLSQPFNVSGSLFLLRQSIEPLPSHILRGSYNPATHILTFLATPVAVTSLLADPHHLAATRVYPAYRDAARSLKTFLSQRPAAVHEHLWQRLHTSIPCVLYGEFTVVPPCTFPKPSDDQSERSVAADEEAAEAASETARELSPEQLPAVSGSLSVAGASGCAANHSGSTHMATEFSPHLTTSLVLSSRRFAAVALLLALAELWVTSMELRSAVMTQSALARTSPLTLVCLLLQTSLTLTSVQTYAESVSGRTASVFSVIVLVKFIQILFCELPTVQRSLAAHNILRGNDHAAALLPQWSIFAISCTLLLVSEIGFPDAPALLIGILGWIPQIVLNCLQDSLNPPFSVSFVLVSLTSRLFGGFYFILCGTNFLYIAPRPLLGCVLLGFTALVIACLVAQRQYGGGVVLPSMMKAPRYDYFPLQLPPTFSQEAEEEGGEGQCVVCFGIISRETPRLERMVTPCYHVFHSTCLQTWMDTQLRCPICRRVLPP